MALENKQILPVSNFTPFAADIKKTRLIMHRDHEYYYEFTNTCILAHLTTESYKCNRLVTPGRCEVNSLTKIRLQLHGSPWAISEVYCAKRMLLGNVTPANRLKKLLLLQAMAAAAARCSASLRTPFDRQMEET